MSGLNVTLSDGTILKINAGDSVEAVKTKFGDDAVTIFEGVDDGNGILEANELDRLKTNLVSSNYKVEVAQDGKTPKKAYNEAIKNMSTRYDKETLEPNFKTADEDKWPVEKGQTLWDIAKRTLEDEGLPTDQRSINDRIAQIANLNELKDVNDIRVGMKLTYKLTEEAIQKVKNADNNSVVAFGGGTPKVNNKGGNEGANPAGENVPPEGREGSTVSESPTKDKESTIKVTPNGLDESWGKGTLLLSKEQKTQLLDGKYVAKYTKTTGGKTEEKYLINMGEDGK